MRKMKSKLLIFAFAATLVSCGGQSPTSLFKRVLGGDTKQEELLTDGNGTTVTDDEDGSEAEHFDRHDAKLLKVISVNYHNSLAPQAGNSYEARNLCDGNYGTAWAVDLDKAGYDEDKLYGPNFTVECKKLSHIIVRNGYGKSPEAFKNNTRAAKVTFMSLRTEEDNGSYILYEGTLEDTPEPQILEIPLDKPGNDYIGMITMLFDTPENGGFYKGKKWNDLCISEVEFWGFE